jgi:restriction system protein
MELPKYHETFVPILEILSNGEMIHYNELQKRVRDKYYSNLPKELLDQKTTTGANILLDRIGWGKSYLKQGKLVDYPQRAMVQITEK